MTSRQTQWKLSAWQCRKCKLPGSNPWVEKISWSWKWQPTPVFLPGKFHGQRSLVGYSPRGRKEPVTTEWLRFEYMLHYTQNYERKKKLSPRILYSLKLSFKNDGKIKTFPDKQKVGEFTASRHTQYKILQEVLQTTGKGQGRAKWNLRSTLAGAL